MPEPEKRPECLPAGTSWKTAVSVPDDVSVYLTATPLGLTINFSRPDTPFYLHGIGPMVSPPKYFRQDDK